MLNFYVLSVKMFTLKDNFFFMKKIALFLSLFFFSVATFADTPEEIACFDLIQRELGEISITNEFVGNFPKTWEEYNTAADSYYSSVEPGLEMKLTEDFLFVKNFNAETGAVKNHMENVYDPSSYSTVFSFWNSKIKPEKTSIRFSYVAEDDTFSYCRIRIPELIQDGLKFTDLTPDDRLLGSAPEGYTLEHVYYNGLKFKKVKFYSFHVNKKGEEYLKSNRWFFIPESSSTYYNMYDLIDYHAKGVADYEKWMDKINSNRPEMFLLTDEGGVEIWRSKEKIDGKTYTEAAGYTWSGMRVPFMESRLLQGFLETKQRAYTELLSIYYSTMQEHGGQHGDALKQGYSLGVSKDYDEVQNNKRDFLEMTPSALQAHRFRDTTLHLDPELAALMRGLQTLNRAYNLERTQFSSQSLTTLVDQSYLDEVNQFIETGTSPSIVKWNKAYEILHDGGDHKETQAELIAKWDNVDEIIGKSSGGVLVGVVLVFFLLVLILRRGKSKKK